ncbi:MAG TPA: hypothetical protein PKM63_03285 [Panacibacter sp.]|nr:hypothetical protein [Panacibacter sp.]HNP43282.1 hypothetical protein [Panacibacter sp.]
MNAKHYKKAILKLISETHNEQLLMLWKEQMEWDISHQQEIPVFSENWQQISDECISLKTNKVISLQEFIEKKRLNN